MGEIVAVDPDTLNDPDLVRNLMNNARGKGEEALALRCQVRLAKLAGQAFDDPVVREFWSAVSAAEEIATQMNGRTTRLARTRQKERRVGARQCLVDWALDAKTTQGFEILVSGGHPELTGEAIVVRYPDQFPPEAVAAARKKLTTHGVDPNSIF